MSGTHRVKRPWHLVRRGYTWVGEHSAVHPLILVFLYSSIQLTFTEPFLCSRQKNPCPQRAYVLVVETDNKQHQYIYIIKLIKMRVGKRWMRTKQKNKTEKGVSRVCVCVDLGTWSI